MELHVSIHLRISWNGMEKMVKHTFINRNCHMMLTTHTEKVGILHIKLMKMFRIMNLGVLESTPISEIMQSL